MNKNDQTKNKNDVITPEVLIRLKAGNHGAFELIFKAFFNRIRHFIFSMIKSDEDAEELTQELFVKLWNNRENVDENKSFNYFMYTMARNATYNFIKHKGVEASYVSERMVTADVTDHAEELIYAREINLLIAMAVSRMPEQRKKVYELSRYGGLSNDEIAQRMNISKKTVENQLSLALKELRKLISLFILLCFP